MQEFSGSASRVGVVGSVARGGIEIPVEFRETRPSQTIFIFSGIAVAPGITTYRRMPE